MRIVNMNMNNNNNNINSRIKIITFFELCINILILIPILLFFLYLKQKESKINLDNKEYKLDFSPINMKEDEKNNLNFRNLNKKEIIRKIKHKHLLNTLTKNKFYGKWFSKPSEEKVLLIGESISGLAEVKFVNAIHLETKEDALCIVVSNYENNFINHWWNHISYIINRNLEMHNDPINDKFVIKGAWQTDLHYGELFHTKISKRYPCPTNFTFSFPKKNVTYSVDSEGEIYNVSFQSIDNSLIDIELNSFCRFNMSMEISPMGESNKYFSLIKEKKQVLRYFILIGIVCVLNILGNICLIKDLNNNNDAIKCISLFSLGYNINWHIYCFLTHISWSVTNSEYYYEFSGLVLAYLLNILFYDFRASCIIWSIIKSRSPTRTYVQKRMLYYSSFYLLIFMSLFILSDLMLYYETIFIIGILAWTPQIIHNIIYYNKYTYPIIYIISFTLDKLIFGIYFRANDNNFLRIKGDKIFFLKLGGYILSNFFILFLQYKFGPRFFLCKKCQKHESNLYKTKKEIINEIKDANTIECVICLMPIFYKDNTEINIIPHLNMNSNINMNMNNAIKTNKKKEIYNQSINSSRREIKINNEFPLDIGNNNMNNKKQELDILKKNKKIENKRKIKVKKSNFKDIIKYFEPFYKFSKISQFDNKPYMKTPCNHVFHKECLEKWILLKKECPNCRHDLSGSI